MNVLQELPKNTNEDLQFQRRQELQELVDLCKYSTNILSEELLEYASGKKFINPWHIQVAYDLLDNILTQEPDYINDANQLIRGKIVFNRKQKINRRIVFEWPRNMAKSTSVSVHFPIRLMYTDANIRMLLCSAAAGQSKAFLREIKMHIEHGEELKQIMGVLKPKDPDVWNSSGIIINRDSKLKDLTLEALGAGGSILSKRTDLGIIDDLLNIKNSKTPEARATVSFWANNVFSPIIEPNTGRLVVVGTPWYRGDYLEERMKDQTYDVRLRMTAYIKDSKTGEGSEHPYAMDIRDVFSDEVIEEYGINAKEGVLWPQRWPLSELKREEKSIGSTAFARQYMCIVISEDTQIIQREWLEYAKLQGQALNFLVKYDVSTCPYGPLRVASGWDLAVGKRRLTKQTSGWTVGITLGRNQKGDIYLLKIVRGKFTPSKIRDQLVTNNMLYQPEKILIEDNAFQESLEIDMQEFTDLPIQGYTTGSEKWDEYIGVNSIGILFENHKIILPYSPTMTEEERMLIDQLVFECESFNVEGHTGDMLMALWFAVQALRQLVTQQQQTTTISADNFYASRNSVRTGTRKRDIVRDDDLDD